MSAGPRYHGPKMWARDRGDAVHWALRTLAQAFGDGGRRPDWRDASRQHPPRWRPTRKEPRWFAGAPQRRPFQGSREPGYWRPQYSWEERQSNWQPPPAQRPGDWRFRPAPRRGPPVAAIKVPRWHWPVVWNERRPCGHEPRGPLRGGPERSACDPQRKHRDSLCGGPERSANDPRLSKTTQPKPMREANGQKGAKWPMVVTVDKGGKEKNLGAALPHRCMESGVLLGRDKRRGQGLPREGR